MTRGDDAGAGTEPAHNMAGSGGSFAQSGVALFGGHRSLETRARDSGEGLLKCIIYVCPSWVGVPFDSLS